MNALGTRAFRAHLVVLLVTLASSVASSQQSTIIQSETRLVLVDTVVTDKKGNYVRDLTRKDFKVFEDNKEQTITSFSHEEDSRKHYTLFFFDDSTAGPALQSFARRAARDAIHANTEPNRLMAIAEFGTSLRVTQNFTDDQERLTQAIAGSQFAAPRSTGAGSVTLNEFANRSALRALQSMVAGLASLPGRKTLIFISGGYPGSQATLNDIASIVEASNRANVAIYPIVPAVGQTVAPEDDLPSGPTTRTARPRGRYSRRGSACRQQPRGRAAGVVYARDGYGWLFHYFHQRYCRRPGEGW